MPRGPAPEWTRRKPPVLDGYVLASVDQAGGPGQHHPETGHYATMYIRGLADQDEAKAYVQALYRSAHYLHRRKIAAVSMNAKAKRDGSSWAVEFRAVDKTLARKHVLDRYGPDRSKWPYDPRRRNQ